jgi:hypothetical protein
VSTVKDPGFRILEKIRFQDFKFRVRGSGVGAFGVGCGIWG